MTSPRATAALLGALLVLPVPFSSAAATAAPAAAVAPACPSERLVEQDFKGTTERVLGPQRLSGLAASAGRVATTSGRLVTVLDTATGATRTFTLGEKDGGLALDSSGAGYVVRDWYHVVKFGPDGRQVWSTALPRPVQALGVVGPAGGERLVATWRDAPSGVTLSLDGVVGAAVDVQGGLLRTSPDGRSFATLVSARHVHTYTAEGRLTRVVGDRHVDNDPSPAGAPLHLYQAGGAAPLPDGRTLVTDTRRGLMLLDRDGVVVGAVPGTKLDPAGFTQSPALALVGQDVFVLTGPKFSDKQHVTKVALSDVLAAAEQGDPSEDRRLGLGAGIVQADEGGYVPAGRQADVRLRFEPGWTAADPTLQVCWHVRSSTQLRRGEQGTTGRLGVAAAAREEAGVRLPAALFDTPDAYRVDAVLVRDGAAVSGTTAYVARGAAGQRLDLAALPPGAGWGGPTPARGVALADVLGTGLFRDQFHWDKLLPQGVDGAMSGHYDAAVAAGAEQARARGTTFSMQLGEGGLEKQLVQSGAWERRVFELVSRYRGKVDAYEVWNEPNITYPGGAAAYVRDVLVPASRAVRAADPDALVVGGSTVGVDLPYFRALKDAGGLAHLDVAGVHPYTGHNRSFEEQGTVLQLAELKRLLVRPDGSAVPLWATESAWWSDGPYNHLAQADNSARALVWFKALGVDKWAYFLPEAGWGNSGVSFSAIEVRSHVKPAALALMTASRQLKGRTFLGQVETDIPTVDVLRFSPREGVAGDGPLLVAWSDGLTVPVLVASDGAAAAVLTRALGRSDDVLLGPAGQSLELTSEPVFLALRSGAIVRVTADEEFGTNLLAASAGARASASSSQGTNPPSRAIDGLNGANNALQLPQVPAWQSELGDSAPQLTVDLPAPRLLDRVVVASHSLGSMAPSLRDYDVQVRATPTAPWQAVAQVRDQFHDRQQLVRFAPVPVSAVRVVVHRSNYSGYADGGVRPSWWPMAHDPAAVVLEVLGFAPAVRLTGPPLVTPAAGQTPVAAAPAPPAAPTAPADPLPVAAVPQDVRLALTGPAARRAGQSLPLAVTVRSARTGAAVGGVPVVLQRQVRQGGRSTWVLLRRLVTDAHGRATASVPAGEFAYRALVADAARHRGTPVTHAVTVTPVLRTTLRPVQRSRSSARSALSVRVVPAVTSGAVLQTSSDGRTWRPHSRIRITDGRWQRELTGPRGARYRVALQRGPGWTAAVGVPVAAAR